MTEILWTDKGTLQKNSIFLQMVYSPVDKLYVATENNNKTKRVSLLNSKDGINWTEILALPVYRFGTEDYVITGLSYIPEKNIYACFYTPEGKQYANMYTSNDGLNWSIKTNIDYYTSFDYYTQFTQSLLYVSKWDTYFITNHVLYKSTDLLNWTLTINTAQHMIYVDDYNKLYRTLTRLDNTIISSSSDGNTWTKGTVLSNITMFSIVYGKGVFVGFGFRNSTIKDNYFTIYQINSVDGINWTTQEIGNTYGNFIYNETIYTPENGLFLNTSVLNKLSYYSTSFDGINWNKYSSYNAPINATIYNKDIDRYISQGIVGKDIETRHILFGTISMPICFVENTPVSVDGAIVPIQEIQSGKHTIRGKPIVAVTKTVTPDKELICFEPHSLAINSPNIKTIMTPHHLVNYRGKMVKAKEFVGRVKGVYTVPYDGKPVYNVLLETHEVMNVNGMTVETLDPTNKLAKSIINLA